MTYSAPNILTLDLSGSNKIRNVMICKIVKELEDLQTFICLRNPLIGNDVLQTLATNCKKLTRLEIGGLANDYSDDITLEGIETLALFKKPAGLKKVKIEYCTKVGDQAIQFISKRFYHCLEEISIIRNYYEKAARISDEAFLYLQNCPLLQKIEIIYSRKFDEKLAVNLSQNFLKLRVLNLAFCPVHVSLEPLSYGCPNLEELNLMGDSWVKR